MKRILQLVCSLLFVVFSFFPSYADGYPQRPIRLIVSFPPGGGTDTFGRFIAPLMEKALGTKIIVNNVLGAAGGAGLNYVWNAPHDGYTIAMLSDPLFSIPVRTGSNVTMKDWTCWIAGGGTYVFAANASSGLKTLQDFLAKAKREPGSIKIGVSLGNTGHWQAAQLEKCGIKVKLVSYGGGGATIQACVSGEVDALLLPVGEIISFIRAGHMVPLATMANKEPVIVEGITIPPFVASVPEWENFLVLSAVQGLMVPGDTPQSVTNKIGAAFSLVMASPEMNQFIKDQYWQKMEIMGARAPKFVLEFESMASYLMQELGIASHNPASLGIQRRER